MIKQGLTILAILWVLGCVPVLAGQAFAESTEPTEGQSLENLTPAQKTALLKAVVVYLAEEGRYEDVAKLLEASLKEESPWAQLMMGSAYYAAEKYEDALPWYERAAAQHYDLVYTLLGEMYVFGRGTTVDLPKAFELFQKGAASGRLSSMVYLGKFYENGLVVEKNEAEAFQWYLKAARQGDIEAQSLLGDKYASGSGVERNASDAVQWYTRAANQGDTYSQMQLGLLYGVTANTVEAMVTPDWAEAYKWFSLAANGGESAAIEQKQRIAALLTPEQLADAEKRVKDWKPVTTPLATEDAQ